MQSDPLMPYYDEMTPEEEKQLKRELDNALADALIQSFKNPIEQSKILNKYVADIGKNLGAMYKDGKQFVRTKRAAQTRNNKKTGFSMKDVQRMLIRQRLLPTSGYDGKYGINTMTAIMNFQRKNKLKPDGIVGPSTGARLEALSLSPEEKAAKLKAAMRADDVNKRAGQSMAAVDTFMDKNKGVRTAATNPQVKTKRDTRKLARKRPPLKEENSKVYNYLEKLINQEIDKILG
jgi:peptidoglycan hydrolase-like protein with peptidoglycan-binding domain